MSLVARIGSLAQRDAITAVGCALTAVWLLLVALFWLLAPGGDGGAGGVARLVATVGVVLPLVLIWLAVSMARAIAMLRAEAEDLRQRLSQMRGGPRPFGETTAEGAMPARSPGQQRPAQARPQAPARPIQTAPAQSAPAQTPPPAAAATTGRLRAPGDQRQAAMRFDGPEPVSVDPATMIRALNFPDGRDDADGIAALRMALKDHDNSRVLRAAQDVVTLLAEQNLYMDDLPPDPASPDAWRRFAEGERGSTVGALGGIHDQAAIEIAGAMLRNDEIFRDTAHHFMRHFDMLLTRLVPQLDDARIAVLAETRSARAFMLLGRVAGIFA